MIMVDEIITWPHAKPPFDKGSCHLTTDDSDLDELFAFARRMGLRDRWFQDHPLRPHYDLTPARRRQALLLGAVFVPMREQALARRRAAKPAAAPTVKTPAPKKTAKPRRRKTP